MVSVSVVLEVGADDTVSISIVLEVGAIDTVLDSEVDVVDEVVGKTFKCWSSESDNILSTM